MVWENVPGVLSSNKGRDFGAFLGGLAELGYGFAYRVLDAQYFGLAQRRKRVFVVGHLGSWRRAAAVLFEPESLSGHPAPRREAGKDAANAVTTRAGNGSRQAGANGNLVAFGGNNTSGAIDTAAALNAKGGAGRMDFESETLVLSGEDLPLAHSLRGGGFDASEDGTGRGTPLVPVLAGTLDCAGDRGGTVQDAYGGRLLPIAFDETQITSVANRCNPQPGDPCHPLAAGARAPTLAFHARQDPDSGPVTHPLDTDGTSIGIVQNWRVRRLTPTECERLQGFPDGYTLVPGASKGGWRGVDANEDLDELRALGLPLRLRGNVWRVKDPDGPRYKALGNSMAVPVMRWIGEGIAAVDAIPKHGEAA
jgi:DNA (cytosine-5)-methyltransferase 1